MIITIGMDVMMSYPKNCIPLPDADAPIRSGQTITAFEKSIEYDAEKRHTRATQGRLPRAWGRSPF